MPPSYYDDMVHHMIRLYGASCGQYFVVVCEHNYITLLGQKALKNI